MNEIGLDTAVLVAKTGHSPLPSLFTALGVLVSALLMLYQMRENRRWNRTKATQDICDEFERHHISPDWKIISRPVVIDQLKFKDLDRQQQDAALRLLEEFENFSLKLQNGFLDSRIVVNHFRRIVPFLFKCNVDFIADLREEKKNNEIFENFLQLSLLFGCKDQRVKASRAPEYRKALREVKGGRKQNAKSRSNSRRTR